MHRVVRLTTVFLLVLGLAPATYAQRLPTGAYNTTRERTFDLRHLRGELGFDFEQKRIIGTCTLRLSLLRKAESLSLDAYNLTVKRVATGAGKELRHSSDGRSLEIFVSDEAPGKVTTIVIEYEARPADGMYFLPDPKTPGLYFVTTYGESGLHANWLPVYNGVNDKFTSEFFVTVPNPYKVISNGELLAVEKARTLTGYHWRQKLPHSGYLMALYVGDFEMGELAPAHGTVPVRYWVPRGRLQEGASTFRNTTRMIEHFSGLLGYRYPWEKYDQIAVPDYVAGAMEHTSVTGHRANVLRPSGGPHTFDPVLDHFTSGWTVEGIISHELVHHWFGNNVTCEDLSYLWLNESFASYFMMVWDEESVGPDQLLFDLVHARDIYFEEVRTSHTIRPLEYHYFDDGNTIYNQGHTYFKGAAILHMLRKTLGDRDFYRVLAGYLRKHEFGNVESRDFEDAIQETTGRNLEWFFSQWVNGAGHPVLELESRYVASKKAVDLSVRQVQPLVKKQGIFRLPARVTIATSSRTWQAPITVTEESQHFILPCEEEPLMVSFDGEGDLVAEIRFSKSLGELVDQSRRDAVPGRIRALRQLAKRYPEQQSAIDAFAAAIKGDPFWGVKAEAARLLGACRTQAAEKALSGAWSTGDPRVRKAAVLALPEFGSPSAARKLRFTIEGDTDEDVVATAILALARAGAETSAEFYRKQLSRVSWNDEIVVACLRAFEALANPALVSEIRKYASGASYNQDVRGAALDAWAACAGEDRELHELIGTLADSPSYSLRQQAIGMLGDLRVSRSEPDLERIVKRDTDSNLTVLAKKALEKIRRVK